MLWGGRKDAAYLAGSEWEDRSDHATKQLRGLGDFLAEHTGRKYEWDRLGEVTYCIKRAAELRLEGMDLCTARPAPATFFDLVSPASHI